MPVLQRKRSRRVKLNHRLGSRRTRVLLAISFSLIALASWYYSAAQDDNRKDYLIALSDLAKGTFLSEANTSVVRLNLAEAEQGYLPANSKTEGIQLVKSIRAGELVTKSMVADRPNPNCVSTKLNLEISLSSDVHVGDYLDVWAAPANSTNSIPVEIVNSAELISVNQTQDALAQSQNTIEVCVLAAEIRSVVNAIAQKYVLLAVKSQ